MSGTAIVLSKGDVVPGQVLDLSKTSSTELKNIKIGLGWRENRNPSGHAFDPDVMLLMKERGVNNVQIPNFYFYNNLVSRDGEQAGSPSEGYRIVRRGYINHNGDNKVGNDTGDSETIDIDLTKVPYDLTEGVIAVAIHDYANRGQNFGMMDDAYIRILNGDTGEQLGKLDLSFQASTASAIEFGSIIKEGNSWYFKAPGYPTIIERGIDGIVAKYNIR